MFCPKFGQARTEPDVDGIGDEPLLLFHIRDDIPDTTGSEAGALQRSGLTAIGHRCADLVGRPGMAALFRIVIAELPRFPELGRTQFQLGKPPYFTSVQHYVEAEHEAGNAEVPDAESAANQSLGMIATYVLWPRMLLTDWNPAASGNQDAVDEAVRTMLARYAPVRRPDPKPGG